MITMRRSELLAMREQELHALRGLHTLEVRATNGSNISLDLRDIYVLT